MKSILTILSLAVFALSAVAQDSTIKSSEIYTYAGVPSNGTSEVDTITIGGTPTAGTFTITVTGGRTTSAITWSATNATLLANVDAALEALSAVGTGGVTTADSSLSSGIGAFTLTFTGKNARQNFAALSVTSSLTGTSPTLAISTTTAGVAGTFTSAPVGALLVDTSTPGLYINTSTTANAPTWTITQGNPSSPVIGQTVYTGTSAKFYLTGSTGLQISGTAVTSF